MPLPHANIFNGSSHPRSFSFYNWGVKNGSRFSGWAMNENNMKQINKREKYIYVIRYLCTHRSPTKSRSGIRQLAEGYTASRTAGRKSAGGPQWPASGGCAGESWSPAPEELECCYADVGPQVTRACAEVLFFLM